MRPGILTEAARIIECFRPPRETVGEKVSHEFVI